MRTSPSTLIFFRDFYHRKMMTSYVRNENVGGHQLSFERTGREYGCFQFV